MYKSLGLIHRDLIMKLNKAILLSLVDLDLTAFSDYHIALVIFRLYQSKQYKGEKIDKVTTDVPTSSSLKTRVRDLIDDGVIVELGHAAYSLLSQAKADPADVVCAVDPFCYISHLSAMEFHGLTDRVPTKLHVTSLTSKEWKELAILKMEKDLGDGYIPYVTENLPSLRKRMPRSVGRMEVQVFNTKNTHSGAYKIFYGRSARVSTVGRTFLEMVKKPELCGGMRHVIAVYQEHANKYLKLILAELNRHGTKIDKVRAGYILDEIVKIDNDLINSWAVDYHERGGSRKLDASADYHHDYSEKWCLSLNL